MLKNSKEKKQASTAKKKEPRKKKAASLIGTRKESSLHKSLKFHYSSNGGEIETLKGSYVCDGKTSNGELIEVQCGSLGPLKTKVLDLAKKNKVRIIHPVIIEKHIELYDNEDQLVRKKKSPRKGSMWDLFNALVYAPELPLQKNLTLELALIDIVEKRVDDGRGSWRRKGISIIDRRLSAWHSSIILKNPRDYGQFCMYKKKELFTVRDLGKKAGITADLARKTLYVLAKIGIVERKSKKGNAYVYEVNGD